MFNIIEKRKILFTIPCIIILAGIICFFAFDGLNTDIDFTGGTAMEIDLGEAFNEDAIRDAINPVEGVTVSSVQSSGAQTAIVKTTDIPQDKFVSVQEAIEEAFPDSKIISRDSVSATMGKEMWLSHGTHIKGSEGRLQSGSQKFEVAFLSRPDLEKALVHVLFCLKDKLLLCIRKESAGNFLLFIICSKYLQVDANL